MTAKRLNMGVQKVLTEARLFLSVRKFSLESLIIENNLHMFSLALLHILTFSLSNSNDLYANPK